MVLQFIVVWRYYFAVHLLELLFLDFWNQILFVERFELGVDFIGGVLYTKALLARFWVVFLERLRVFCCDDSKTGMLKLLDCGC